MAAGGGGGSETRSPGAKVGEVQVRGCEASVSDISDGESGGNRAVSLVSGNQEVASEKPPWSQARLLSLPLLSQAFVGRQASCSKDGIVVAHEPVTCQLPVPVPTRPGQPSEGYKDLPFPNPMR